MSVTVLHCDVVARAYVLCVRLRYDVWRYIYRRIATYHRHSYCLV